MNNSKALLDLRQLSAHDLLQGALGREQLWLFCNPCRHACIQPYLCFHADTVLTTVSACWHANKYPCSPKNTYRDMGCNRADRCAACVCVCQPLGIVFKGAKLSKAAANSGEPCDARTISRDKDHQPAMTKRHRAVSGRQILLYK